MANFAKLNDDNVVIDVIAVSNDVITVNGNESEQAGIDFLNSITGHSKWKQTSYNNNFRNKYAGIGNIYLPLLDVFIPSQPYLSWTFNETSLKWEAPVEKPNDGKYYGWFEPNKQWIEVTTND
jgi:hypothetical protein